MNDPKMETGLALMVIEKMQQLRRSLIGGETVEVRFN
jgi:hypothetical protein